MSRSHLSPQARSRRRKAIVVIVVVVVVLVGWVAAVSALSGGGESAQDGSDGPGSGEGEQASAPETTNQQQPNSAEEQTDSGQDEEPPPTHPDVPSEPSPPGDWKQGEAPKKEKPPVEENASSGGEQESSGQNSSGGNGDQDSSGEGSSEEGSSSGGEEDSGEGVQEGFDPLGKDPQPGDLTETDKDRASSAADRYVTAAYGYTGNSKKEYEEGISQAALTQGLYRSPGGKRVKEYAKAAGKDGITSAAVMEDFRITSTNGSNVEGTATFEVGRSYNRYGELKGNTTTFRQDLTLSVAYGSYKVSYAEVEQEVSDKEASSKEGSGGGSSKQGDKGGN